MPHHATDNAGQHAGRRILLVEDDEALSLALSRLFANQGYGVQVVNCGEAALRELRLATFDQMVLDITMPGIDGFEVLRRLRGAGNPIQVLVLTARDAVEHRVHGLNLGADDYLVKPFAVAELLARMGALARCARRGCADQKLVYGALTMDVEGFRVYVGNRPIEIPAREWGILRILLERADRIVSKDLLARAAVRPDEHLLTGNAIDVSVSRLRAKLETASIRIRSVRGFGYMLTNGVSARSSGRAT
jgi:two-component system, OmpR family, response regulator